jgi:hypothetical protein
MAISAEEILLRLGLDAGDMQRGTYAMLDAQKKASLEYVAFWESALEKQAAAESKANDASLAKLEANLEAKAAATKVFFEEQAAQYEIAQGSIGAGMLAGGAAGKAERSGVSGVEGALLGGGAVGGGQYIIGSRALRGGITAVRGALIGSWNYIIRGLVSAILGIGIPALAVLAGVASVLGISELIGGPGVFKTLKAFKVKKASEASLKDNQKNVVDILKSEISTMKEHQILSPEDAQLYESFLKNPNQENLIRVFNAISPLIPKGGRNVLLEKGFKTQKERDDVAIKSADELADRAQKILDKKKDEKTIEADIAEKTEYIFFLKKNLAALDQNSLEYHQAHARLLGYEVDLMNDQAQIAKDLKEQGFMVAGSPELAKAQQEAHMRYMKGQIHAGEEEAQYPTVEELAGRGWTERLNKLYGKGGRFDLGRGRGMYAGIAQDYELAQKQQIWDREHGNIAMAEKDRQRMISDVTKLQQVGVANPAQLLGKIGDDVGKLSTLFHALVKQGAIPINVPDNP